MIKGIRKFRRLPICIAVISFVLTDLSIAQPDLSVPLDPTHCLSPTIKPAEPINIYSATISDCLSPSVSKALSRVYVPNHASNSVTVIDPTTLKVVSNFKVGLGPQHIIPSWDLKTLWVANNANRTRLGSMTPIDPLTSLPGKKLYVSDPYNMYFMPDGSAAIIVDEAYKQLDFRDPQTMKIQSVLHVPDCHGINHADFSADSSYAIFTCEFRGGNLAKIDLLNKKVLGMLKLSKVGMPQDIRLSADGKIFYVADMINDGVFLIDSETFTEVGFIATGIGAHGLTVSRDGKKIYVSNRGSHNMWRGGKELGSVTVIDFATRKIEAQWTIPGGGSPDMGNVSADGKQLWLAGRFHNVVYMFDTTSGAVVKIPVGGEPHGLTVWPQPGRYSQGHTGNMR